MTKSEFKEVVKNILDANFKDVQIKGMDYTDGFYFEGDQFKDKKYYVVLLSGIGIKKTGITGYFDCNKWIKRIRVKNNDFSKAQNEFEKYTKWLKEIL